MDAISWHYVWRQQEPYPGRHTRLITQHILDSLASWTIASREHKASCKVDITLLVAIVNSGQLLASILISSGP